MHFLCFGNLLEGVVVKDQNDTGSVSQDSRTEFVFQWRDIKISHNHISICVEYFSEQNLVTRGSDVVLAGRPGIPLREQKILDSITICYLQVSLSFVLL